MISDDYYSVSKFTNAFSTLRALILSLMNETPMIITLLQKPNNQFPSLIAVHVFRRLANEFPTIIALLQMLNR